jgi:hypothetical protein
MKVKLGLKGQLTWDKEFKKNPELDDDPELIEAIKQTILDGEERTIRKKKYLGRIIVTKNEKVEDNCWPVEIIYYTGIQTFYPLRNSK